MVIEKVHIKPNREEIETLVEENSEKYDIKETEQGFTVEFHSEADLANISAVLARETYTFEVIQYFEMGATVRIGKRTNPKLLED